METSTHYLIKRLHKLLKTVAEVEDIRYGAFFTNARMKLIVSGKSLHGLDYELFQEIERQKS